MPPIDKQDEQDKIKDALLKTVGADTSQSSGTSAPGDIVPPVGTNGEGKNTNHPPPSVGSTIPEPKPFSGVQSPPSPTPTFRRYWFREEQLKKEGKLFGFLIANHKQVQEVIKKAKSMAKKQNEENQLDLHEWKMKMCFRQTCKECRNLNEGQVPIGCGGRYGI